jgi:phosphoribosylaminoimidazolecarboxamide formyltransferase / IMP cyclohydrolase
MTRRALLSVSDKSDIEVLGRALTECGWEILSTGGTAEKLRDCGVPVTPVSEVTGHPEIMSGRVKTLHPAIHGGLLARRDNAEDLAELAEHGYGPIDLVAVNLYPFRETISQSDVTVDQAMGTVDIGGPTMIRAAAKNHKDVTVVVDPADYGRVLSLLDGDDDPGLRRELAAKVFEHISAYDAAIASFLRNGAGAGENSAADELPWALSMNFTRVQPLRYGENPGQAGAFYRPVGDHTGLSALEQMHGKELSYNNILDLDGALLSLAPFAYSPDPAVCIVKHTTPCGLAIGASIVEAYQRALACDPVSAYGSTIAVNRPVDLVSAQAMAGRFIECVVAPAFDPDALEVLSQKRNIRLLVVPGVTEELAGDPSTDWWAGADDVTRGTARFLALHGQLPVARTIRSVYGGLLAQSPAPIPFFGIEQEGWSVPTERQPTEAEWTDLAFAWAAVFGVKSNAILLARDGGTIGIGAGQMSRVDSSRIAVQKASDARLSVEGAALASDAFFPFRDGVDAAAEAGVMAIIQPGGSIRDEEVVAAANGRGIAMVFTGQRLFRH